MRILFNKFFVVYTITSIFLISIFFCSCTTAKDIKPKAVARAANGLTCDRCNQSVLGGYIKADGYKFHQQCFVCSTCDKPITGSYQSKSGKFYHTNCYKKKMGLVCAKCGKLLHDRWKVFHNQKFHEACFNQHIEQTKLRCNICGKGINGKYTKDKSNAYHIACFRKHKLPKCGVCSSSLEGRVIVDPWGNKAHEEHGKNQTGTCSSCQRIISGKTSKSGYRYSDGRTICGICKQTAISKKYQMMKSRNTVLALLHSKGITNLPTNIPINLVDKKSLKKHSKAHYTSNSKGFTRCMIQYKSNQVVTKKQTIYILTGLPMLEFKGVLAHELMHAWLNENNISMPDYKMEGFCNLGAMVVYQDNQSKFAQVLLDNMEKDPDPVYGKGYRHMKQELKKLGWRELIRKID